MTSRRQYLIAYDISDDKRRTGVFKLLMGQGDHVQFSVFLCSLNEMELVRVRGRLAELIHTRDDQVIIVDLGPAEVDGTQLLDCLGKAYNPPTRVQVI